MWLGAKTCLPYQAIDMQQVLQGPGLPDQFPLLHREQGGGEWQTCLM